MLSLLPARSPSARCWTPPRLWLMWVDHWEPPPWSSPSPPSTPCPDPRCSHWTPAPGTQCRAGDRSTWSRSRCRSPSRCWRGCPACPCTGSWSWWRGCCHQSWGTRTLLQPGSWHLTRRLSWGAPVALQHNNISQIDCAMKEKFINLQNCIFWQIWINTDLPKEQLLSQESQ